MRQTRYRNVIPFRLVLITFAGVLLMFFLFGFLRNMCWEMVIALINLYYLLIRKSDTYKVTDMAILFNIIIFANFHNTIAYSASSLQLIYPVLFSMFSFLLNQRKLRGDAGEKLPVAAPSL